MIKAPRLVKLSTTNGNLNAVVVLLVAVGVLDFGYATVRHIGEKVIAHGNSNIACHTNLMVVEDHIRVVVVVVIVVMMMLLMLLLMLLQQLLLLGW